MKKLITVIIVASLALTIQAQDITNTLGTDGNFFVNKTGGTSSYLTLSSTDNHVIQFSDSKGFLIKNAAGNTILSYQDIANFTALTTLIVGEDAGVNWTGNSAHFQLQQSFDFSGNAHNTFRMVGRGAPNLFEALYSNESGTDKTDVVADNPMLAITAMGYKSTAFRNAAQILFKVDGSPTGTFVPGRIDILTGTAAATPVVRMTIKNDGTVNIAGLSGTGTEFVKVDASGNLVRSASKGPSLAPINKEIQLLKEENETLKAEMAELHKMVELLMEEK